MNAHTIKIEWEEDGCWLILDLDVEIPLATDEGRLRVRLEDPEALYNACRADIGPWLYERDQALATYRTDPASPGFADTEDEDAYDLSDPKHPRFHSTHVDIWDAREKGLV